MKQKELWLRIRGRYPKGMRVCRKSTEEHTDLRGKIGTVIGIDVIGNVIVRWDNGEICEGINGNELWEIVEEGEYESRT